MTLSTPPAGGRGAEVAPKPAASLLTVPIFRDQPGRRRANAAPVQADPVQPEPVQSTPVAPAPEPGPVPEPGPAARTEVPDRPAAPAADGTSKRAAGPNAVDASSEPANAPASGRPAPPRAAPPQPAAEPVYRDLRQYWRARMNGGLPRVEALDDALIARAWPYTMLIRVPADGALDIAHVYAPAGGAATGAGHPFAGDRYSQLSTWVLGLAGEAFGASQIREARETFDLGVGRKRFTARLLPCRRDGDAATYLLLQLQEG